MPLEGIRSFAEETGFEGSEVEWEEQLEAMQQFFRWAPGEQMRVVNWSRPRMILLGRPRVASVCRGQERTR